LNLFFLFSRWPNLEPQTYYFFLEVRTLNLEPIIFFLNGQTLNLGPFATEICEPGDLEPQTLNLKMGDFPCFKVAQPNELTVVHRDYEQ
jgi:hypothetical protein